MPSHRTITSLMTFRYLCLPLAEVPQDILIARPDVRRTMGLPDLVLPVNGGFLVIYCLILQSCMQEVRQIRDLHRRRASRVNPTSHGNMYFIAMHI